GSGWKHICAVKHNNHLELFVNGKKESISSTFNPSDFDLSNGQPLRIGFGETDYFSGKIREVQAYDRTLSNEEIKSIFNRRKKDADTGIE
ncbi:LamG domain-containing protein, partial [Candidatus Poribacteria bacterium]|nr:LamG domain-containing protein [Candidatus Poribacteria bacterium]